MTMVGPIRDMVTTEIPNNTFKKKNLLESGPWMKERRKRCQRLPILMLDQSIGSVLNAINKNIVLVTIL